MNFPQQYCRYWRFRASTGIVFFCANLFAGFPIIAQQPSESRSIKPDYLRRVHFGDLVDIHVAGHLDFDWRGRVNPEGFLDGYDKIPKQIYALCRTESEIAAEISHELAVQLREPKTEVKIVDISMRPAASIDGAIAVPTRFQVRREARLNEIITAAGGITDRSSGKITILRPQGLSCIGKSEANTSTRENRIDISIAELLSGKEASNPVIVSGDMIVVSEAAPVYIVGAVATQGRMDHRPEMTLSRAIDSIGGVQKEAVTSQVTIFRRNNATSETISADLEKIRSKAVPDIELKPFDIIDVPYKGRPPRKFPPVAEIETTGPVDRTKFPLKIIE